MRVLFGISIAISRFIYQVECVNTPNSGMYLPDGTNGFVCLTDFLTIDYARQIAKKALDSFFFETYFQKYPKLFEETHLFDVETDILLSWPALSSGKVYMRGNPGQIRLIINTRGQIMGMVMITSKGKNKNIRFEKCNPVRRSLDKETVEMDILDEHCSMAYPRFGYNCGSKFFPVSTMKSGRSVDSKEFFEYLRKSRRVLPHLRRYEGNEFTGDDLYIHPVSPTASNRITTGPPGPFRVIFDMKNLEFKGLINLENRSEKCVTVWDLSSTPPDYTYSSSSILNTERVQDTYWPKTCNGHKFKYKTIWLYTELALKSWWPNFDGREASLPFVTNNTIKFWPIRVPEGTDNSPSEAFALGYNRRLKTYALYQAEVYDGRLDNYVPCLDLPQEEIRILQKKLSSNVQL